MSLKAIPVVGRRDADVAQEGAPHRLRTSEAAGISDFVDARSALLEAPPRMLASARIERSASSRMPPELRTGPAVAVTNSVRYPSRRPSASRSRVATWNTSIGPVTSNT